MELFHMYSATEEALDLSPPGAFVVEEREEGKGKAVYSRLGHARGELIARFTGRVLPYRTQHTLQINPAVHLLDLDFVGYLAHSCSPNVFVDMQGLEVWALEDVGPEAVLAMDYAATEDLLFKQFACLCGSPGCRHWITGRKELVNDEGRRYLQGLAKC
jgi:hypothetical protein